MGCCCSKSSPWVGSASTQTENINSTSRGVQTESKSHSRGTQTRSKQGKKHKVRFSEPVEEPRPDSPPRGSIRSCFSGPPNTKGPRKPLLKPTIPRTSSGTNLGRNFYNIDHPEQGAHLRGIIAQRIFPFGSNEGFGPPTPPPSRRSNARTSSESDYPGQHYQFQPRMTNDMVEHREYVLDLHRRGSYRKYWTSTDTDLYGVSERGSIARRSEVHGSEARASEASAYESIKSRGGSDAYHSATSHLSEARTSEASAYHSTKSREGSDAYHTATSRLLEARASEASAYHSTKSRGGSDAYHTATSRLIEARASEASAYHSTKSRGGSDAYYTAKSRLSEVS